ncbi:MAG TPA: hypothetical protein PK607_08070 [Aggregatilineales bacterium]|nr:hypothetical protein [Aggregatilineales bacterium]
MEELPAWLRVPPIINQPLVCEVCGRRDFADEAGLVNHYAKAHRERGNQVKIVLLRWIGEPEDRERLAGFAKAKGYRTLGDARHYLQGLRKSLGRRFDLDTFDPCPERCQKPRPFVIMGDHPIWLCADCWILEAEFEANMTEEEYRELLLERKREWKERMNDRTELQR